MPKKNFFDMAGLKGDKLNNFIGWLAEANRCVTLAWRRWPRPRVLPTAITPTFRATSVQP